MLQFRVKPGHGNFQVIRRRRHKLTVEWLLERHRRGHKIEGKCLDVGDRSDLTGLIERIFQVKCDNTEGDLEYGLDLSETYKNIFCFEVIEHHPNPLLFIRSLRSALKDNGTVWLSTPTPKPRFLKSPYHFYEYSRDELVTFFDKAGFRIEDEKVIRSIPIWWGFTGIRPFLRMIGFNRTRLLRLR